MVELVVSSADTRGKDFTQVQGPRVEVTPLRPACLSVIDLEICWLQGSRRDADLARVLWYGSSLSGSMALPALK